MEGGEWTFNETIHTGVRWFLLRVLEEAAEVEAEPAGALPVLPCDCTLFTLLVLDVLDTDLQVHANTRHWLHPRTGPAAFLPTYSHLLTRPGFHSYLSQTHLLPISLTSPCTNSTHASSQTHLLPISLTSLFTNSTHASSQSHLLLPIFLTSPCTPHSRQLHSSAATQTPQIPHADAKTLGQNSSI